MNIVPGSPLAPWNVPLLPPRAAVGASEVDHVFTALLAVAGFFTLLILVLILRFVIKYHAGSRADRSGLVEKTWHWEVTWIVIPTLMTLGIFIWAAFDFFSLTQPPANARMIYVVAKQWMWKFRHPEGQEEINELHVPLGVPIKLLMRSQDVIHSFYVPAFRVKQDVLPGRYTTLWFTADRVGVYHLFCAQYCGTEHSQMTGQIIVMTPAAYQTWLAGRPAAGAVPATPGTPSDPLALRGKAVFYRLGCQACHTPYSAVRAPRLDGIFGRETRLSNGQTVIVDEQYLRESILNPDAKIVAGYTSPSLMPTYAGQLTEDELLELIAYIKSLREGWPQQEGKP